MDAEYAQLIDELAASALRKARQEVEESGYDAGGVDWLESHIEVLRVSEVRELTEEQIAELGSFFGKCILERYGGEWTMTEGGLGVRLPNGSTAFPMGRVRKQFAEGEFSYVGSLYRALEFIGKT
ncbi:MAG: hypothetical protein QNJ82_05440 [Gammaproteobacteria bacterium]|nr:hypothetical protein [Gammaproteobacteria bacterium]